MSVLIPWIRVVVAVVVYLLFATLASLIVRRAGKNLKDMQARTSAPVLAVGTAANLCVLGAVLLLLAVVDRTPLSALGLTFRARDLVFALAASAVTFALAVGALWLLQATRGFRVERRRSASGASPAPHLATTVAVLVAVVLQEEVLYRGYLAVNLLFLGPWPWVAVSTLIFVAVHFLTNRAGVFQTLSWLAGGVVLALVYLVSGSIWVPVVLHLAMDLTNVLVFNIAGGLSLFTTSPALNDRHRALYRLAHAAVILGILVIVYGVTFRLGGG